MTRLSVGSTSISSMRPPITAGPISRNLRLETDEINVAGLGTGVGTGVAVDDASGVRVGVAGLAPALRPPPPCASVSAASDSSNKRQEDGRQRARKILMV